MKGKISYLLCLSLLLSACSYDQVTEVCPEGRETGVTVSFTLSLEQTEKTKADDYTWGDQYETIEATAFENRILPETVKVFAYDNDGAFIEELSFLRWTTANDGTAAFNGYFRATQAGTYKFVVIANCTNESYGLAYDYVNNIPTLDKLHFYAPDLTVQTTLEKGAIPMWGITTCVLPQEANDATGIDLGTVWMLRSLAKVEVALSNALSSQYALGDVTISNYNTVGNCLPAGWTNLASTQELGHVGGFNAYNATDNTTANSVSLASGSNGAVWYLYVPEYLNVTTAETYISLNLYEKNAAGTVGSKVNGEPFKIYFRPYTNGVAGAQSSFYNVTRNHYYQYTVTQVSIGSNLELECLVQPWSLYEENLNFDKFVSVSEPLTPTIGNLYENQENNYIVMADHEYTTVSTKDGVTTEGTLTARTAQMTFTILTPKGYTWYASLIADDEGKPFGFVQFDENGRALLDADGTLATTAMASGSVGSQATLTVASEYADADILSTSIQNRLQVIVRNESTGHVYVVEDDVLGGTCYLVHNK